MNKPIKSVVLLSGGMDSTTLLYYQRSLGIEVHPLLVHYGQRHQKELMGAEIICHKLQLDYTLVNLEELKPLMRGSSQTDSVPVPEGHYADASMKATVVPNRNMIMLSCAAALAISLGASEVAYAAHAGDHAIYPDCRPEFVQAMRAALNLCHYEGVRLMTPFIYYTKAEILKIGLSLKVPYQFTYSCYQGGRKSCGKCGTCVERTEAFALCGATDPIEYETDPLPQSL